MLRASLVPPNRKKPTQCFKTYVLFVHGLLLTVLLLLCDQQLFEALGLLLQQTEALLRLSHLPGQTLHQLLQLLHRSSLLRHLRRC